VEPHPMGTAAAPDAVEARGATRNHAAAT